jgi:hypothetical protein
LGEEGQHIPAPQRPGHNHALDFSKNVALFANFLGDFSGKCEALGGLGGVKISW